MSANVNNPMLSVLGSAGAAPGPFPFNVLPHGPAGVNRATAFRATGPGAITVRLPSPRADGSTDLVLDLSANNLGRYVEFTHIVAADVSVWPVEVEFLGQGGVAWPSSSVVQVSNLPSTMPVEGVGSAGSPVGRVLSVQGVSGGTPLPTTNASVDITNGVTATQNKPLASATYAPSVFADRGASDTDVVKSAPGNVFALSCRNSSGAGRYFQLHNSVSPAAPAEVPAIEFLVGPGEELVVGEEFFTPAGVHFSTGISFGFSTTSRAFNPAAGADQDTQVIFK